MNYLDQQAGSIADTSEPEGIRHFIAGHKATAMSAVRKGAARADTVIRSLTGSDRCEAEGLAVKHNAPVLAMCRALIDAGCDPERPLEAYRGDVLCLRVSNIGYGAQYTVEDGRRGAPVLRRFKVFPRRAVAPPMRPDQHPCQ
jgi:hypothetical protein